MHIRQRVTLQRAHFCTVLAVLGGGGCCKSELVPHPRPPWDEFAGVIKTSWWEQSPVLWPDLSPVDLRYLPPSSRLPFVRAPPFLLSHPALPTAPHPSFFCFDALMVQLLCTSFHWGRPGDHVVRGFEGTRPSNKGLLTAVSVKMSVLGMRFASRL